MIKLQQSINRGKRYHAMSWMGLTSYRSQRLLVTHLSQEPAENKQSKQALSQSAAYEPICSCTLMHGLVSLSFSHENSNHPKHEKPFMTHHKSRHDKVLA